MLINKFIACKKVNKVDLEAWVIFLRGWPSLVVIEPSNSQQLYVCNACVYVCVTALSGSDPSWQ